MNLLCRLEHLAGQDILVNGKVYQIGENGLCCDISPEDGAMLIEQGDTWRHVHEEDYTRVKETGADNWHTRTSDTAYVELPPGEELDIPAEAVQVHPPAPKKRGRPKKSVPAP